MTIDIVLHLRDKKIDLIDSSEARKRWKQYRLDVGYGGYANMLTAPTSNTKLNKSKNDAVIYGLSLAPAKLSKFQVCRFRSKTCEANCVAYSGKGELPNVSKARITRTEFLGHDPSAFMTIVSDEVTAAKKEYKDKLAVRMNTFSDVPWEQLVPWFFEKFSDVQFYDYTKWSSRRPPKNYHLTRSASENTSDASVKHMVRSGTNVAVVFSPSIHKPLPEKWNGLTVIDGDKTDARFKDAKGVVVGLRAKGKMRKNPGEMVRQI